MGIETKIHTNQPVEHAGSVSDVGADQETQAFINNDNAFSEIRMQKKGAITWLTINTSELRTTGTCKGIILINGVKQNADGQFATIDENNLCSAFVFMATPIPYEMGDIITLITETTGFAPTTTDALITIETEDT